MRREIAILIAALITVSPALAARATELPAFTGEELQAIAHDANLCSLMGSDPQAVRDYFDRTGTPDSPDTAIVTPCTPAAGRADPDSQKGISEAIWELNQLMKNAGGQKQPQQPEQPQQPQQPDKK